jgi:hypothetical protein
MAAMQTRRLPWLMMAVQGAPPSLFSWLGQEADRHRELLRELNPAVSWPEPALQAG